VLVDEKMADIVLMTRAKLESVDKQARQKEDEIREHKEKSEINLKAEKEKFDQAVSSSMNSKNGQKDDLQKRFDELQKMKKEQDEKNANQMK
jgi:hypothetical protein